jgi:hypothetical protein
LPSALAEQPLLREALRAEAPADMLPGSPFGPNLRAFVIYLRFMHAISFERLARLPVGSRRTASFRIFSSVRT